MRHRCRWSVTVVVAVLLATGLSALERQARDPRWVTAWATSQQGLGQDGVTDATVRLIARVTAGGESVRIRLDNTYGTEPLQIGSTFIGQRQRGPALLSGSNMPVRFGGSTSVTIPPGGSVRSDPVRMTVLPRQDLAVSLYVQGANIRPSQHRGALVTSYVSADGSGDIRIICGWIS